MIAIRYNLTKDRECWQRVIGAGVMFGHKFPSSFKIDFERVERAKKSISAFDKAINAPEKIKDFRRGIKKIYKYDFPKSFICYINTSPYSMDGPDYISISVDRSDPTKLYSTFVHEACHYMFLRHYTDFCKSIGCADADIENIKEIVTVINDVEFRYVKDCGWRVHYQLRKVAMAAWQEFHDIKTIIKEIKNLMG